MNEELMNNVEVMDGVEVAEACAKKGIGIVPIVGIGLVITAAVLGGIKLVKGVKAKHDAKKAQLDAANTENAVDVEYEEV